MSDDQDGCEWVSFFWYWPTRVVPYQRPLNGCVCVCVYVPVAHGDAAVAHIWACFYLAVFATMTLMYLFSAVHAQLVLKALAASRQR